MKALIGVGAALALGLLGVIAWELHATRTAEEEARRDEELRRIAVAAVEARSRLIEGDADAHAEVATAAIMAGKEPPPMPPPSYTDAQWCGELVEASGLECYDALRQYGPK